MPITIVKGDLGSVYTANPDGKGLKTTTTWYSNDATRVLYEQTVARTPNFRNVKGILKPLPYTLIVSKIRYSEGWDVYYSTVYKPSEAGYSFSRIQGCFGESASTGKVSSGQDVNLMSSLRRQAEQKLLTKLKNTSANMAVASAEADSTMKMVGRAAGAIGDCIGNLKRGDFAGAASAVGVAYGVRQRSRFNRAYARDVGKAVTSGWLELQYGWKPLLNDVYGAIDELARHQLDAMVCTTSAVARRDTPLLVRQESKPSGKVVKVDTARGQTVDIVKVSVTYSRVADARRTAKETGLTNPGLVMWEKVPYSFVFDWFLPIGAWLNTFDATLGLSFHSGYRTEFHKGAVQFTTSSDGVDRYGMMTNVFKSSSESSVRMVRSVLTSFPTPTFPSFKNPASYGHFANGMALLANAVGRR